MDGLRAIAFESTSKRAPSRRGCSACEKLPNLFLCLSLPVRDALKLHDERAVQHVAAVGGHVDAV